MGREDAIRELKKTLEVLKAVDRCFTAEATMNAAKHMSQEVVPNPLASAVKTHIVQLAQAIDRLEIDSE